MNKNLSHRKASVTVRLTDREGSPISCRNVRIEQVKHEFLFGCGAGEAVLSANPTGNAELDEEMRDLFEKWRRLFNYGTVHCYWGRFEPERGKPNTEFLMNGAKLLRSAGCAVKGHPLVWHTVTAPWLLSLTDDEIQRAVEERVTRDVTAFKGVIDMWDVINEVVIMPVFDKYDNGITRLCNKLGRLGIVDTVFARARECNPDATLLINDFNTSQAYEILIEGLLYAGVPIDVIGIQSHQHQGFWGLEKLEEVLERFSRFGKPIHFTENTFVSGDIMPSDIVDLNDYVVDQWPSTPEGEQRQAENMRDMVTTLFEHPLVQGITQWDFRDGGWLGAPSGLVRKDGSIKPSYEMLDRLINHEWHTSLEGRTDENGMLTFEGFKGDYEITCGELSGRTATGVTAGTELRLS